MYQLPKSLLEYALRLSFEQSFEIASMITATLGLAQGKCGAQNDNVTSDAIHTLCARVRRSRLTGRAEEDDAEKASHSKTHESAV